MRSKSFDGCTFSIKPVGGELSNSRLVELLGEQAVVVDEYRDKQCTGRSPQDGYVASAEKLVLAYTSMRENQALRFEFFVRFAGEPNLNQIMLVPDRELETIESLHGLITRMLSRIRSPLKKAPRPRPGVFAANAIGPKGTA